MNMRLKFSRLLIGLSLLLGPQTAWAASRQSGVSLTFTLADLGEGDLSIEAIFDQAYVHFPLAEGLEIQRATLHLHLSHDPKLLPELSDLTLALNDEPVINLPLTADNAKPTLVDVPLPSAALRPGDNTLLFRFNLRLRDTGCADRADPNLWAKVFADTSIELNGADRPIAPDLARYPAPFTTLSGLGGPQIVLVLPGQPTRAELTAAVQIAAALGQAAHWPKPPLQAVTIEQLTDEQASADHLIVIDTAGRNPLAHGIPPGLTEMASPRNPRRLMLVVSGADEAALFRAADMLSTQSAYTVLNGAHSDAVAVTPQPIPHRPTRATFAELGFSLPRMSGLGLHDLYFPLDVPYDWKLTEDASVELSFIHAPGLSSANSRLSVFVNGLAVTDVALTNRNDTDGRLTVHLSPRQMHPGRNLLHLAVDLHMPEEDCNFRYREEAWAEVSPESSLNLAHVVSEPPVKLRYLPSAFVLLADLSADVFVLPDQPRAVELTAMVRLAARLGTYTTSDSLRPRALLASEFAPTRLNTIIVGQPEAHALLAEYDAQLPQPLSRLNGSIQPAGGRELLPGEAENQAGYLEVFPAPWSAPEGGRGTVLIISGHADEAMLAAVEALPTLGHPLDSQGNVGIVHAGKVTGLTIGQLARAPLSGAARGGLAVVLIGTAVSITGVGLFTARRRKQQEQESKRATE